MTQDDVMGIIRTVLAAVGGLLVTKGYIDNSTLQAVVGALATLGVAVWSVIQKKGAATKLAAAVAAPAGKAA